jgi:thiol-disulfide isomerase/thioredoxin
MTLMTRSSWTLVLALATVAACARPAPPAASKPAPAPAATVTPVAAPAAPAPPALPPEMSAAALSSTLASHRGQQVLINVFASWCSPCKQELPDIDALHRRCPKLYLLGIDVDAADAGEALARFLPTVPKSIQVVRQPAGVAPLLPSLHLPQDWNESVPAGWEGTVPLTFVFDADGSFATGSVGQLSPEALAAIGELCAPAAAKP